MISSGLIEWYCCCKKALTDVVDDVDDDWLFAATEEVQSKAKLLEGTRGAVTV